MVDFLRSFPIAVLVGAVLGAMSGMGVGGGSLLILWLSLVLGTDVQTSRLMNLMFFVPCAVICTVFRMKKGVLSARVVIPAAAAGCLCAYLATGIDLQTDVLRRIFGVLLVITGIREVCYRGKNAR